MRCKKIYACDLGNKWIDPLKKSLKERKVNIKNIDFQPGNILKLNYQKIFDFVVVNGVLPHLKNKKDIKKGFAEEQRCVREVVFTSHHLVYQVD